MKSLLKNLGMILIIIGAVVLIACFAIGNVNSNNILGTSLVLIIVGLVAHIVLNKRIAE
mgnify:FL=1